MDMKWKQTVGSSAFANIRPSKYDYDNDETSWYYLGG
jgi:hypothetical protein